MSPMLIGIGIVLVLVILAAVFFMSKRNSTNATTQSAVTNRPKTLAEQQLEIEQRQQGTVASQAPVAPTVPSASDDMATAQRYLAQQDYANAAMTLKQAIKNHPHQASLYAQLLNVFAQAKDYKNFNTLYPQVLKLNDPTATQQANTLKSLMDEELAFSQPATVATSTPIASPSMALDTASTPTTIPNTATVADSMDFDFLDTAEQTLKTQSPAIATPTISKADDDLDFDLSFDEPTTNQTPVQAKAPSSASTADADIDFDFNLDTSTTTDSPVKEVVLEDGGELSLDSMDDSHLLQTDTPLTKPTTQELAVDDFNFNFDEPATTTVNPVEIPAVVETQQVSTASEETLDDFDFNFDEPVTIDSTHATPQVTDNTLNLGGNEFDLAIDEVAQTPVQPTVTPTTESLSTVNVNDFALEEVAVTSPVVEDAASLQSPVTPSITPELNQAFNLLNDIDSTQLNVELAEQYVNLGEYDSAKRLLDEIDVNAQPQYQAKIQQLLEKIA